MKNAEWNKDVLVSSSKWKSGKYFLFVVWLHSWSHLSYKLQVQLFWGYASAFHIYWLKASHVVVTWENVKTCIGYEYFLMSYLGLPDWNASQLFRPYSQPYTDSQPCLKPAHWEAKGLKKNKKNTVLRLRTKSPAGSVYGLVKVKHVSPEAVFRPCWCGAASLCSPAARLSARRPPEWDVPLRHSVEPRCYLPLLLFPP